MPTLIERGLIIGERWIDKILAGEKTWELRGSRTTNLEKIGLIKKGSTTIVGVSELTEWIGPLQPEELRRTVDRHGVPAGELSRVIDRYDQVFAWELSYVEELDEPVPYQHPQGAPQELSRIRSPLDELLGAPTTSSSEAAERQDAAARDGAGLVNVDPIPD